MALDSAAFIKTGDLVNLYSEDGEIRGFVAVGGSSDDQVVVNSAKDKDSVFKIVAMIQPGDMGLNKSDLAASGVLPRQAPSLSPVSPFCRHLPSFADRVDTIRRQIDRVWSNHRTLSLALPALRVRDGLLWWSNPSAVPLQGVLKRLLVQDRPQGRERFESRYV